MSKVLSDTAAIAGKYVLPTANPDYSGFRCSEYGRPMRENSAGPERPAHAIQVLRAKRPGTP
jgi:hypothetical protein